MAIDAKEWQELYEGAREVFGPFRAAIFMKGMEPALRGDLVTTSDLRAEIAGVRTEIAGVRTEISDTRAAFEEKLRAQTWTIVGAFAALGALNVTLSQLS